MNNRYFTARRVTWFSVLLALTILLQVFGSAFQIGTTRLTFTLVPIIIGSVVLGAVAGMILGLAFGLVVLIAALVGADPFTLYLLQSNVVMTLLIIFVKGALCGLIPGLVFKAMKGKHFSGGVITASVLSPIINTGIFIIGALMMSGVMGEIIASDPDTAGQSVIYFLIVGCAGINFLVEFAINVILAPVLVRLIKALDRDFN